MKKPDKDVTIYDIAKRLNISAATVSRSMGNHAGTSEKTRQMVLAMAKKMGYNSNAYASNLRSKKSHVIGVIVPRLNSNFIAEVIAGIEVEVNKANYTLIVSQSLEKMAHEINSTELMTSNRVAGVLASLAYDTGNVSHFENLTKKNIPVIFFDRVQKLEGVPAVFIDNVKAGYEVTDHLVQQGCKNIMHVTASQLQNVYADRYKGYRQALAKHGLPFVEGMVAITNLSGQDGVEIAEKIMKMAVKPDGIFFANDTCAVNCMVTLKKNGIRIPQDVAIAGFNNDPVTCLAEPNLTTVDYNGFAMGKLVARMLINHLNHKSSWQDMESVILKSNLIVRASSLRNPE